MSDRKPQPSCDPTVPFPPRHSTRPRRPSPVVVSPVKRHLYRKRLMGTESKRAEPWYGVGGVETPLPCVLLEVFG